MLALGIDPQYILDDMELYEAEQSLGAGLYKDMYLMAALRQMAFLNLSVWTSEDVDMLSLMPLPFDEKTEEKEPADFDTSALYEESKHLAKTMRL